MNSEKHRRVNSPYKVREGKWTTDETEDGKQEVEEVVKKREIYPESKSSKLENALDEEEEGENGVGVA